jgi:hypothetical protein
VKYGPDPAADAALAPVAQTARLTPTTRTARSFRIALQANDRVLRLAFTGAPSRRVQYVRRGRRRHPSIRAQTIA